LNGALLIRNRQRTAAIDSARLRRFAQSVLRVELNLDDFELRVHLVDAAEMSRLNRRLLGHAGVTDVITLDYAAAGQDPVAPTPGPGLLGEVFICVDVARIQARRFRTTWQAELARYLIHGILHLRGMNDGRAADRRRMKREEDRLWRRSRRRYAFSGFGRLRAPPGKSAAANPAGLRRSRFAAGKRPIRP
jgi:rRNA maturation RNase YbeY